MRNLKKALSLALALVMLLGMMVVGAGAATTSKDYSDNTDISADRVEAVNVMSAVGVFEGTDGAFNPSQILTREEGAKLVAYMLLGDAAENLVATSATYSDVATDRWSAGVIEHCSYLGILAGHAGKFDPTGKLTNAAFAKMMLCALGYEAEAEGFTGANWSANVRSVARRAGIDEDLIVNNDYMTREDAAQMAFNTMKADVVEYTYKGDSGYGQTTSMPNRKTNYRVTTIDNAGNTGNGNSGNVTGGNTTPTNRGDTTMQFCELYFPALKLVEGDTNGFGDIEASWKLVQGSKTETVSETEVGYAQQYTSYVTQATIYKDLGMTAPHSCDLYVDGTRTQNYTISNTTTIKVGGNGAITTVWTNENGDPLRITVKNIYVGDVVAVNSTAGTVTVAPRGTSADGYISGSATASDFAVGDVVLYNKRGSSVVNVTKPETVTGTLAAYNSRVNGGNYFIVNGNATVDGTAREYSDKIATAANEASLKRSVRFILDTYGYVIDVEGYVAPNQYAYVIGYRADPYDAARHLVKLVLPTGETKEVYANAAATGDRLVSYTVDPVTGIYTLSNAATPTVESNTNVITTKGNPSVSVATTINEGTGSAGSVAAIADAKTVFIVRMGPDAYNVYLGIANVPTIQRLTSNQVKATAIVDATVTNLAKAVYIDATTAANVQFSGSTADHVFVLRNPDTPLVSAGTDSAGRQYYIYTAIVNGALKTDFLATNAVLSPTLYSYVAYDAAGIATLSNSVGNGTGTVQMANNAVGLGGTAYIWDNTTLVYKVAANGGSAQPWSVAGIKTDTNDKTWVVGTSPAKLIIFQEVADSVTPPPATSAVEWIDKDADNYYAAPTYYTGNGKAAPGLADIEAMLKAEGCTGISVKDPSGTPKWSFTTKAGLAMTEVAITTAEVFKVTLHATNNSATASGVTGTLISSDVAYTTGTATVTIGVTGTSTSADDLTISSTSGTVGTPSNGSTKADGTGNAVVAGLGTHSAGKIVTGASGAVDARVTVSITSITADTTISIAG